MWWNKQQKSQHDFSVHPEFFLGAQTVAAGSIEFESDILLDGRYSGDVTTSGLIEIGNNSEVSADLNGRVGIIEGKYKGKAHFIDEVQVKNCASVDGSLESANILVEKGAQLSAKCKTI